MVGHKDGLLVLAAVASPFISAFAVITGPFIQRKIAEQSNRLNREQFAYQRKQTQATLQGNYNQRWADRFSEKAAEFIVNSGKIQRLQSSKTSATDRSSEYREKLQALRDKTKFYK